MKRHNRVSTVVSVCGAFALVASPLFASAEVVPPPQTIIITEIQTGSEAAGDEFIELHNPTDNDIGITGWQLRYIPAGSTTSTRIAVIPEIILPPHKYFTVRTESTPAEGASEVYTTPAISRTDKTVALYGVDLTTCQLVVQDAVAWSSDDTMLAGEGTPLSVGDVGVKDKLLQRLHDSEGRYIDTNNNAADFRLSQALPHAPTDPLPATIAIGATPGWVNGVLVGEDEELPVVGPGSTLPPLAAPGCELPTVEPEEPEEPEPEPEEEPGAPLPPTEDPEEPETPQTNIGLAPPVITELLPNPGAPQSDEEDEFIELYNPNDTPFDLSGYILETGLTTKHQFVFPDGSMLEPGAYIVLRSIDTDLTLTNSGGQVRLLNPAGEELVSTGEYPASKESQTWALVNGTWQWTSQPTPGGGNQASPPPVVKAATAKKKATTKKATTAKAKTTSQSAKTKKAADTEAVEAAAKQTASAPARLPLHIGVLALVAALALLYGAYEYRHDLANKFHRIRSNRAARREARARAKGR